MTNFHIVVELKCCKDTAPDQQRQNAIDQHQELVAELRNLFGAQPIMVHNHTPYYDWGDMHNLQRIL